jgi:hypothetical protein
MGLAVAMIAWDARAMPSSVGKLGQQANGVTLVAQGCGVGWHWSPRWRRCVR